MSTKNQDHTQDKLAIGLAVSKRIEIQDVQLIETAAHQELVPGELPGQLEISVHSSASVNEESSTILVDVACNLVGRYKVSAPAKEPVLIRAVFRVTYRAESLEGLTKENYDAFGETNGVYNVWPYWREYVQSMTSRMGLPSLTIPVFRLGMHAPRATARKSQSATGRRSAPAKRGNSPRRR